MRFFLTAPLFAALAAALLLWQGDLAWATRWSPQTLALVHLLTLGCLSMCMAGALLQLLPVVAGTPVPAVQRVGATVHALLCAGTLLLVAAFWLQRPWLFALALAALVPALMLFALACAIGLWRYQGGAATAMVASIRLALAALVITVVLGALLAGAWLSPALAALPLVRLTDLHAMWGLLGWIGLLVIGVAFQVVPMFQSTDPYPAWLTGRYCTALFMLLVAASVASGMPSTFHAVIAALTLAGYGLFASATLWLLFHRKRSGADPTTLHMRCAMASVLVAMAWWFAPADNARALAVGVLFIIGFAFSMVSGMLYKIVPFLVRLELQVQVAGNVRQVPSVGNIIPPWRAKGQFMLHAGALALLVAACYWAPLVRAAATAMLLACLALWSNLVHAMFLYARATRTTTCIKDTDNSQMRR